MNYKLRNFHSLYADMKAKGKPREKFQFAINHIRFEVIFLIDREPFELLVGVREKQFAFILQVMRGFMTELPENVYFNLCEILELNFSDNHFSSVAFLQDIDAAVPLKCSQDSVQPHEIAYYKRDVLDENKIYFCGWNDHLADGRKAHNFEKTRKWLGVEVANFCIKNNISSMWTDNPQECKNYVDPQGLHN